MCRHMAPFRPAFECSCIYTQIMYKFIAAHPSVEVSMYMVAQNTATHIDQYFEV